MINNFSILCRKCHVSVEQKSMGLEHYHHTVQKCKLDSYCIHHHGLLGAGNEINLPGIAARARFLPDRSKKKVLGAGKKIICTLTRYPAEKKRSNLYKCSV